MNKVAAINEHQGKGKGGPGKVKAAPAPGQDPDGFYVIPKEYPLDGEPTACFSRETMDLTHSLWFSDKWAKLRLDRDDIPLILCMRTIRQGTTNDRIIEIVAEYQKNYQGAMLARLWSTGGMSASAIQIRDFIGAAGAVKGSSKELGTDGLVKDLKKLTDAISGSTSTLAQASTIFGSEVGRYNALMTGDDTVARNMNATLEDMRNILLELVRVTVRQGFGAPRERHLAATAEGFQGSRISRESDEDESAPW